MTLIRDAYRAEILGGLAGAGEEVLHVFLQVDAAVGAAAVQPDGTLLLHSGKLTPAELADEVPAAAALRQVH